MLFELEEGDSRKLYRIERDGAKLVVRWGRIGTRGQAKTTEFATEAEAQAEYEAQVRKRRERGYRQVRDASAPRDAEAARKAALGKARPLAQSPRFLFVHRRRSRFVWLEASGSEPLTAEGPVGAEAEAEPRSEPCGSPAAASRRRDTAMAKLMASGFELATFAAAEVRPVRRAPSKKDFARDPGLEAHLAEAPGDAARWEVYEDWPLEQGDPRTALIEAERGGSRGDAAQERGRLLGRLLGPESKRLIEHLRDADWRAGLTFCVTHGALKFLVLAQPPPRLGRQHHCVMRFP